MRWTKASARLGPTQVETGYVIYVDNGYVTAIEAHTYGESWPTEIWPLNFYSAAK